MEAKWLKNSERQIRYEHASIGVTDFWWFFDKGEPMDPQVFLYDTGEFFCMNASEMNYGEEEKIAGPFDTIEEAKAVAVVIYRMGGFGEPPSNPT